MGEAAEAAAALAVALPERVAEALRLLRDGGQLLHAAELSFKLGS